MKTSILFCLPILLLLFVACEKDDAVEQENEPAIVNISFSETSSLHQPQEILVTIVKPTPCHQIKEVKTSVSGRTYNYDFILSDNDGQMCITVIARETVKVVDFAPTEAGDYTLNFYINGKHFETRTITVTE